MATTITCDFCEERRAHWHLRARCKEKNGSTVTAPWSKDVCKGESCLQQAIVDAASHGVRRANHAAGTTEFLDIVLSPAQ